MFSQVQEDFQSELQGEDLQKYGPFSWMVRPCEWYQQEYNDCKSFKARIHQYFIFGKMDDCNKWKDDYYNCYQFRKNKNETYLKRIIESELLRKDKRLAQSKANDVWEYRDKPPSDW